MEILNIEVENVRSFGSDIIFFDVTVIINENITFKTEYCSYNFYTDDVIFCDEEFEDKLKNFEITITYVSSEVYHYIKTNNIQNDCCFDILDLD